MKWAKPLYEKNLIRGKNAVKVEFFSECSHLTFFLAYVLPSQGVL